MTTPTTTTIITTLDERPASASAATPHDRPRRTLQQDPFASPALSTNSLQHPTAFPRAPEPCIQAQRAKRSTEAVAAATVGMQGYTHMHTGHDRHASRTDSCYQKMGSWSSGDTTTTTDGYGTADLEKGNAAQEYEQWRSSRASKTSRTSKHSKRSDTSRKSKDSEKQQQQQQHQHPYLAATGEDISETDERAQSIHETNAVKILLFLAGPAVGLSFINLFWTIISLLITTLTQPVRLCARRPSFAQQLAGLLGPALNLQLRCIYTPLPPHANEDGSYRVPMLVAVHLLSPFVSVGVALTSWVVAVYWVLAAIVGEPDPAITDKRDDGRETCLALRGWWEAWLAKSLLSYEVRE